jgi:hypothetical protein
MARIPGVAADAVVGVDSNGGEAQFMHYSLPDKNGTKRPQRRHRGTVPRCAPAAPHPSELVALRPRIAQHTERGAFCQDNR